MQYFYCVHVFFFIAKLVQLDFDLKNYKQKELETDNIMKAT